MRRRESVGTYENVLYEKLGTEQRIGKVTLNRPEKLNALSPALLDDLGAALNEAEHDDDVRVVILTGAGRAFSAGFDIAPVERPPQVERGQAPASEYDARSARRRSAGQIRARMHDVGDLYLRFWNMRKVSIVMIRGYAVAGGCELAMFGDLILAAEDAQLGHPGIRGLGPPRTGCIWPLVIGMRKTKELLYTGDMIDAREAERLGMINKAVPAEQLEAETLRWAERIATQAGESLAVHKHVVNRFYENMGIYASVHSATDFDALYQFTEQAYAWQDKVREAVQSGGGLREALAWRDEPYRRQ